MQPQSAQPSASYYGVDENEQHWLFGDNQLGDNQPLPAELSTLADGALQNLAEMISDDDLEVLTDLVETFLSEALRQIQAMQRALQADDMAKLFLPAHSMKSSAATFGAMRMAKLSEVLEATLANNTQDKLSQGNLVHEIEDEYSRVVVEMRQALADW